MFKRLFSLLAVLTLLFGYTFAETTMQANTHQIEMKTYPFYIQSPQEKQPYDVPLYFVDGVNDLPYIDVVDFMFLMYGYKYQKYFIDIESSQVIFQPADNNRMILDFINGTIYWDDYDAFFQSTPNEYISIIGLPETDASGQPYLLQHKESSNRHGDNVLLNLSNYGISMIAQDNKYLVPLHTLSTFCIALSGYKLYFNGQCVILAGVDQMENPVSDVTNELIKTAISTGIVTPELIERIQSEYDTNEEQSAHFLEIIMNSELGKPLTQFIEQYKQSISYLFLSGQTGKRSPELAQYGYNELCLELDSFYGLKELHSIESFDSLLSQNGLKETLFSTDAQVADTALSQLIRFWLDDGHSGLLCGSNKTDFGQLVRENVNSQTMESMTALLQKIQSTRAAYPESQLDYYEVGNTAYVKFDDFTVDTTIDYYSFLQSGNLPTDTISLIAYAHKQITRENSPIENVVLDLSGNGGGLVSAAAYVLGWFLGDAHVSIENTFTGAQSTATYRADVNLDHKFDESDTISNLNLYCLISPYSFSCGNLVPWAFKADGRVTLIGKTSGGGSCLVAFSNTAWGTSYRYSGQKRVSFVKNGSFYDVDQGVVPDYFIRTYDHFYDREALTEFINSLY